MDKFFFGVNIINPPDLKGKMLFSSCKMGWESSFCFGDLGQKAQQHRCTTPKKDMPSFHLRDNGEAKKAAIKILSLIQIEDIKASFLDLGDFHGVQFIVTLINAGLRDVKIFSTVLL